jgi:hypothetical protein
LTVAVRGVVAGVAVTSSTPVVATTAVRIPRAFFPFEFPPLAPRAFASAIAQRMTVQRAARLEHDGDDVVDVSW